MLKIGVKVIKKHSISVLSSSCGVKSHTIRVWEKRYNLFSPDRTERGQRLYGDDDLSKAKLIASLIDCGHSISSLAEYNISELEELKNKINSDKVENKKSADTNKLNTILRHMSSYQIDAIADELQHARLSTGAREFILDLVLPVIREIGELVAKGKYSVTQEHITSTIIRDQLSQIYLPNLGHAKTHIALATPEGNLHEFSILIADILCRSHRISTRYLGATHPAICLAEAINVLKTPFLVLGVISSDQWDYEKNIIPYLKGIDDSINHEVVVVLGGGYKLDFPDFIHIKEVKVFSTFEDFDKYLEVLL